MEELIETTGISSFNAGEKLSSSKLNKLNTTINEVVGVVNRDLLKGTINLNKELGDSSTTWTLKQVIREIPLNRRAIGLSVTFLEDNSGTPAWITYTFLGESLEDIDWYDELKWQCGEFDIIDGGEW